MKNLIFLFVACFSLAAQAQKPTTGTDNRIYMLKEVSQKPELEKNGAFETFFKKEFKAAAASEKTFEFTFVIEKNGGPATQLRPATTLSNETLTEIKRVLKAAGRWKAGQKDGKPVRVMYRYTQSGK